VRFEVNEKYLAECNDNVLEFEVLELGEGGWVRANTNSGEGCWLNTNLFSSVRRARRLLVDPNHAYHLKGCIICGAANFERCPDCRVRVCSEHMRNHQHR
jgi:hypothetical protein